MTFAKQMFRRLGCAAIAVAFTGVGTSAGAEPSVAPPTQHAPRCAEAGVADVPLPRLESIDEIRVIVSRTSPAHGAARVEVTAGEFDRVLHIRGSSHGLWFSTPLSSSRFVVTIDPVLNAPSSACIERVELRGSGQLVAAIQP